MKQETKINKIVTVTLNPSLDKTLITNHLHQGYHNHVADSTHLDASGRGVNVSRALDRLGISTHAIVLIGNRAISRAYRGLISEENFAFSVVRYDGTMRSDTIIVDRGEETETHIIDEGASCTEADAQNVLQTLLEVVEPGDLVVLAGTLPSDVAPGLYVQMTEAVHQAGAKVVVLASGEPLRLSLAAQPEIVTLTRLEAEVLFNYPIRTYNDMISGSRKLLEQGAGQVFMVAEDFSSGVLVDESDGWIVEVNDLIQTGTGSGVTDAMLAGYLSGLSMGISIPNALALGAASLAFAVSQIGNQFGSSNQLQELLHKSSIQRVEITTHTQVASAGQKK